MESLPDGISSTSKTQSSVPSIGNRTPSTSGTPRSSRPPSPRQSRNGTSSSASSAATTDQGLRPVHQQKQPSKVHESMQHEEELPSSAKQFCDPSNTKPEPVSSSSSGVVDRPVESSSKNTDSVTSVSLQEPQNRAVQSKPICSSPQNSLCAPSVYNEAKQSFTNTEVSECGGESVDVSNSCDFVESRKTSMYRGSTGSDLSDESSSSSLSNAMYKPHKANDVRWEAIQLARHHYGALGVDHFRLINKLGCGDIGSVYLSELKGTRSYFAMKVMDKAKLASRKKLLRAQTEREILQSLDHPFLPTLYTHFETENHSCLVMEYCPGGDLHNLRQRQPGKYFSEHAARFYVAEVLLALEYLHMLGIIYRDLKPENVLVREDGHIMLSDFDLSLRCAVCPTLVKSSNSTFESKSSGYCVQPACIEPSCVIQPDCIQPACFAPRFFRSKKKEKKSKPKNSEVNHQVSPLPELIAEPTSARSMSFVGTHEYLAPEIIKGEGHGSAVDWWTFGIFLYELLFGKTPFKGQGNRATLFNVVGQPLRFPESPSVSFAARDLIRGLLVKEPQHRLAYRRGATEIKQHPFFQSVNWALIRCANPPDVPKPVVLEPPVKASAPPPAPAGAAGEIPGVDMKPAGNYYEIDFF